MSIRTANIHRMVFGGNLDSLGVTEIIAGDSHLSDGFARPDIVSNLFCLWGQSAIHQQLRVVSTNNTTDKGKLMLLSYIEDSTAAIRTMQVTLDGTTPVVTPPLTDHVKHLVGATLIATGGPQFATGNITISTEYNFPNPPPGLGRQTLGYIPAGASVWRSPVWVAQANGTFTVNKWSVGIVENPGNELATFRLRTEGLDLNMLYSGSGALYNADIVSEISLTTGMQERTFDTPLTFTQTAASIALSFPSQWCGVTAVATGANVKAWVEVEGIWTSPDTTSQAAKLYK